MKRGKRYTMSEKRKQKDFNSTDWEKRITVLFMMNRLPKEWSTNLKAVTVEEQLKEMDERYKRKGKDKMAISRQRIQKIYDTMSALPITELERLQHKFESN